MALTTAQIQQAYVTFFSRPADPVGLAYWSGYNGSVADLYATFAQQSEYSAAFSGLSSAQKVNVVYQNLFGRDAEATGLLYWAGKIESGAVTVANLALAVSAGAQTTDKVTVDSRVSAATSFTAALDTAAEVLGYSGATANASAKAWLAGVTTAANLATAVAAIDTAVASTTAVGGAAGSTFTLTTSIDTFTGTTGNDTFIADASTAVAADQIAGGAGTDTFKLYDGAGSTDIPATTGVEIYDLQGFTTTTDFSGISGLQTIALTNATTAQTFTADAAVDFDLAGMADGEAITLASTATDSSFNIAIEDMGTIAGAGVTVNANGAAVTTINLAVSGNVVGGKDSDIVLASTGTEKTVNVTGSGDLSLTTADSVTLVDASAATGKITLTDPTHTAATTLKTGSGNDTVTAAAAVNFTIDLGAGDDKLTTANLSSDDSIAGGDGTDTIAVAYAVAADIDDGTSGDKAVLAKITGFEKLEITDDITGTLAMDKLGFNSLVIQTGTSAGGISGVTSGAVVTYTAAVTDADDVMTVTMTDATLAGTTGDTLNVVFAANIANNDTIDLGDLSVSGINKVTFAANDSSNSDSATNKDDGYSIGLTDGTVVDTITVTGASELTFTVAAGMSSLATYNAAAATGNQIFVGTSHNGNQGIEIVGGSGDDTITSTTKGDKITLGAGKDTVSILDDAVKTTITDFAAGTGKDIIQFDVSALGSTIINGGAVDVAATDAVSLNEISGKETAAAADNLFVLTGATYATTAEVKAAIVSGGARQITLTEVDANEDILVAYSNGTDSYIAVVNINNAATTIDDHASTTVTNFVQLTGVNVSVAGTLHADNFGAFF